MAAEKGPMSGFRDMLPEQMIARQAMFETIQTVYEGYGFTPLKTPALERLSTLQGKYGEEADNLIYSFQDLGGRDVAMRYDQTVPLARVVGQHAGRLPVPYKRYAVGEVWRGDSPQAGRYREFTQYDADIVGTTSPIADAEVVAMMSDVMTALDVDSTIMVNNRRILDGLAEKSGSTTKEDNIHLITTIDKTAKDGQGSVVDAISERHGTHAGKLVDRYLSIDGAPLEKLAKVSELLKGSEAVEEGVANLNQVFALLESGGYSHEQATFDQSIARGLSYYTGIIFETMITGAEQLGSVCSGGRFDNLVKDLGGPDKPAVGTSIGVDRLYDALEKLGKLKTAQTNTEVLITNFGTESTAHYMQLASALRHDGIATEVYYDPVRLKKQLSFANKLGVPYVVLAGPEEIERGVVTLKTLASGEQQEVPVSELSNTIFEHNKQNS